jgi:hypothetical protein
VRGCFLRFRLSGSDHVRIQRSDNVILIDVINTGSTTDTAGNARTLRTPSVRPTGAAERARTGVYGNRLGEVGTRATSWCGTICARCTMPKRIIAPMNRVCSSAARQWRPGVHTRIHASGAGIRKAAIPAGLMRMANAGLTDPSINGPPVTLPGIKLTSPASAKRESCSLPIDLPIIPHFSPAGDVLECRSTSSRRRSRRRRGRPSCSSESCRRYISSKWRIAASARRIPKRSEVARLD